VRTKDKYNYDKPNKIIFELEHDDVYLDFFKEVQEEVTTLRSGDVLQVDENKKALLANGKDVIRFSKKFLSKIEEQKSKGYDINCAIINHMVWWHRKDVPADENVIILPNIEFRQEADL